jgi:hypothetical protein
MLIFVKAEWFKKEIDWRDIKKFKVSKILISYNYYSVCGLIL